MVPKQRIGLFFIMKLTILYGFCSCHWWILLLRKFQVFHLILPVIVHIAADKDRTKNFFKCKVKNNFMYKSCVIINLCLHRLFFTYVDPYLYPKLTHLENTQSSRALFVISFAHLHLTLIAHMLIRIQSHAPLPWDSLETKPWAAKSWWICCRLRMNKWYQYILFRSFFFLFPLVFLLPWFICACFVLVCLAHVSFKNNGVSYAGLHLCHDNAGFLI